MRKDNKIRLEKQIYAGTVGIAYGSIADIIIREKVLVQYEKLLEENLHPDKKAQRHLVSAILPAIAIYRVLKADMGSTEQVFSFMHKTILESAKKGRDSFHAAGRLPFFFQLLRVMCKGSMKMMFGKAGWQYQWKKNTRWAIEWECHACVYHDTFCKYGMPEMTAVFCECDDITYGSIPGVLWKRKKTIGNGDKVCEFCFYKE